MEVLCGINFDSTNRAGNFHDRLNRSTSGLSQCRRSDRKVANYCFESEERQGDYCGSQEPNFGIRAEQP